MTRVIFVSSVPSTYSEVMTWLFSESVRVSWWPCPPAFGDAAPFPTQHFTSWLGVRGLLLVCVCVCGCSWSKMALLSPMASALLYLVGLVLGGAAVTRAGELRSKARSQFEPDMCFFVLYVFVSFFPTLSVLEWGNPKLVWSSYLKNLTTLGSVLHIFVIMKLLNIIRQTL